MPLQRGTLKLLELYIITVLAARVGSSKVAAHTDLAPAAYGPTANDTKSIHPVSKTFAGPISATNLVFSSKLLVF